MESSQEVEQEKGEEVCQEVGLEVETGWRVVYGLTMKTKIKREKRGGLCH